MDVVHSNRQPHSQQVTTVAVQEKLIETLARVGKGGITQHDAFGAIGSVTDGAGVCVRVSVELTNY